MEPGRINLEDEFHDCEEIAAACETADGEEHAKGEVTLKRNLPKLPEAQSRVIMELSVPPEVESKHHVL